MPVNQDFFPDLTSANLLKRALCSESRQGLLLSIFMHSQSRFRIPQGTLSCALRNSPCRASLSGMTDWNEGIIPLSAQAIRVAFR